jgi:hypothetical protein
VAPLELRPTIYLVDYEQRTLRPFESKRPGGEVGQPIAVDGSLAGRAFATLEIQTANRPAPALWIPILNGTTRLGVLHVALPDHLGPDDLDVRDGCLGLAGLAGHLLQSKSRLGTASRRSGAAGDDRRVGTVVGPGSADHLRLRRAGAGRGARAVLRRRR